MKVFTYKLKEGYPVLGGELECRISENPTDDLRADWRRPAVIIVPGGGYHIVSRREGETIADLCAPCGVCRQVMAEFCALDFEIILAKNYDDYQVYTLEQMLPLVSLPIK